MRCCCSSAGTARPARAGRDTPRTRHLKALGANYVVILGRFCVTVCPFEAISGRSSLDFRYLRPFSGLKIELSSAQRAQGYAREHRGALLRPEICLKKLLEIYLKSLQLAGALPRDLPGDRNSQALNGPRDEMSDQKCSRNAAEMDRE